MGGIEELPPEFEFPWGSDWRLEYEERRRIPLGILVLDELLSGGGGGGGSGSTLPSVILSFVMAAVHRIPHSFSMRMGRGSGCEKHG